ncbi:hypothetical protein F5148DRAFT_216865 [Russula earlei]|uniref:Uncharacterized protein n=1 Tax=Russula earlei TaxID=71964 RepID=A0ACC0U493_9AGAM|nr:hypothetical protein F5148DRAFT_216865 [Russula earlei]
MSSSHNASITSARLPNPPDLITYSYASRMVYVTPEDTYDNAIESARDSFPELCDVDRGRIRLAVRVSLGDQNERKLAEIGRRAWPLVITTFTRFAVVEISVASAPRPAAAPSTSSRDSASAPPAYEVGTHSNVNASEAELVPYRPQSSRLQPHTQDLTRHVRFLPSGTVSSRGRVAA